MYPVTAGPVPTAGATHDTSKLDVVQPELDNPVGAAGAVHCSTVDVDGLSPAALTALTAYEYDVPALSPTCSYAVADPEYSNCAVAPATSYSR